MGSISVELSNCTASIELGSKYGFNGQQKVNEIAGAGNWTTAKYWEYGTRVATRKNPDPITNPSVSPYAVFDGNPIKNNDPLGNQPDPVSQAKKLYSTAVSLYNAAKLAANVVATVTEKVVKNTTPAQRQEFQGTAEFLTGVGPANRHYDENEPITQSLKSSYLTTVAVKEYAKGYLAYKAGLRPSPPTQYRVDFSLIPGVGDTGPLKEYKESGGWSSLQYTGTATYFFDTDEKNGRLNIRVYDTKTEYSLLYHFPGTDRHQRSENPVMGETTQTYDFSMSAKEVTERASKEINKK